MRNVSRLVFAASVAFASMMPSARAADYIEPAPEATIESLTPRCDDAKVLGQVEDQFEHGAVEMLQSDVTIAEFSQLQEKAWFPRSDESSFERRYCQGNVLLSNMQHHIVYYRVSYPLGYASVSWKAEGCVLGLDKWNIYGANCQSLRRF